jgi:hypothetical protein
VALGNMKNIDLIILPAGFTDPTTALRPSAIAIVFGVRDESLFKTEDQIWRYILVNDTGCTVTRLGIYYVTESVKGSGECQPERTRCCYDRIIIETAYG